MGPGGGPDEWIDGDFYICNIQIYYMRNRNAMAISNAESLVMEVLWKKHPLSADDVV